jgi:acyl carrier protein
MTSDENEIQQNTDNSNLQSRGGLSSISDSLAAMFLQRALEKGYGIEIPSLGIKIEGAKKASGATKVTQ